LFDLATVSSVFDESLGGGGGGGGGGVAEESCMKTMQYKCLVRCLA
jgi:hypothetical protein